MSFKIFIIDDNAAMLQRLKDFILEKYGDAELYSFSSGEAVLPELLKRPDVIVLDYHLDAGDKKTMNGIEILKKIKELMPDVPVIFMASNENPEMVANTINYGAYDYISKNDGAFHRLEIMINNATGHFSLHHELRIQKVYNRIMVIVLILFAAALIFSRFF